MSPLKIKIIMKYLLRAVKYYIKLCILITVILTILVFIGAAEGNIETMFRDGYKSVAQIAAIFAVIAAIYPKVGYIRQFVSTEESWAESRERVKRFMENRDYILEKEEDGLMAFRCRAVSARIGKSFEDRITVSAAEGGIELEGLRKDALRIAAGLDRIQDQNNAQ